MTCQSGKILPFPRVECRHVTSSIQRVGAFTWYGPADGRQWDAKHPVGGPWPDRKLWNVRDVGRDVSLFCWVPWRLTHGAQSYPPGWTRSGFCSPCLPYFRGDDLVSNACEPLGLGAWTGADRVLFLCGLCDSRKLAE